MEENGFEFRNVRRQYKSAIIANLIMLGHGCVIGWFTPSLKILMSENTPLINGPLTNEQISWLGSINNLGALGGILTFGFITSYLGCKRAMLFLAFPSAAFWFLVYFGNTYGSLLFARFFTGWTGGGIQTTLVLYISEIANNDIRGTLCSLTTLCRNFGILLVFIAGAFADYYVIPCIFISFPIVYLINFLLLPNTPQFYLYNGKLLEAENALKYYKGYRGTSQLENNAINTEFDRLKALANQRKEDKNIHFRDFVERKAIKGLLFGISLGFMCQFPGGVTFLNYAVMIFEKSGASQIDPYISSIMLAIAQIIGCLFSTKLVDSLGRKLLMVASFFGPAISLFIFWIFLYFNRIGYDLTSYSWVPVAILSFIQFIATAGVGSLYSVCFVENLPTKIRTIGLTICVLSLYVSAFVFVKMFPILVELIDLDGVIMLFTIGSLIGTLFLIFSLKEKKGQSLDSLQSTGTEAQS